MERSEMKHRAVAAGLGGAVGLVVPTAAIAVLNPALDGTPFGDAGLVPFAAGALAGVAVMGVVAYFAIRTQEHAFERELDAVYAASGAEASWEAPSPVQEPEEVDAFEAHVPEDMPAQAAPVESQIPAEPHTRAHHGVFGRRRNDDVPVIERAAGALSEEEAWAEIDAAMSGNPSISCDPVRSKDIYQIALEELAAKQAAPAGPAASPVESADVAASQAEGRAATAFSADAQARDVAAALASLDEVELEEPEVEQRDYAGHEGMWAAALAVLEDDGAPAEASAAAAPAPVAASAASAQRPAFEVLSTPASTTASFQVAAAASQLAAVTASFAPSAQTGVMYVPAYAVPLYVPAHMHARAESLSVQERVNEILEEEFSKNNSKSVRATSRKYLSVVNGGTASWSRLETGRA